MTSEIPTRQSSPAKPTKPARAQRTDTIGSASFQSLLFTQWMTAINDNAFRWLVVGIGKDYVDQADVGWVLSLALGCFVLPYLLLAAPAGYLADRFSKRDVIIACKVAEIVIMVAGVIVIINGALNILFVLVFFMGAQSALFAPSKMGTIPELLPANRMSAANGLFNFSTVTATILGMGIGLWLSDVTQPYGKSNIWISASVLVGLAAIGTVISLGIRRVPAANPTRPFPWNAPVQTIRDLHNLYTQRSLFLVAMGIVFYWTLGALAQLNIDQFATESGAFDQSERIPLLVSLVLGVGVGSVLAGIWSGGRIELGMLSIASFGIMLFAGLLVTVNHAVFNQGPMINGPFLLSCFLLLMLGVSAGVFDVPLAAYLQHRSPPESRGAVLSAANFCIFTGILFSALAFYAMRLPVHSGSLNRVPDQLADRQLTNDQLMTIDQSVNAFLLAWDKSDEDGERPEIETYLRNADPQSRDWLLANLLWTDMRQRMDRDENVLKLDYFEQCDLDQAMHPSDKTLVKQVYEQASDLPLLTARQIFLVIGLMALPVWFFITLKLPQASARFVIWWWFQAWFHIRIQGLNTLPERGPMILLGNRGTWFHRLMIHLVVARKLRAVTWRPEPKELWRRRWQDFWKVIHICGGPTRIQERMAEARKTLRAGNVLAVFPESNPRAAGTLSLSPEVLKLIEGMNIPLVPVHIDTGDVLIKQQRGEQKETRIQWFRAFRKPIMIYFDRPHQKPPEAEQLSHMISHSNPMTSDTQPDTFVPPVVGFIRQAKRRKRIQKVADSTGVKMTGGVLLAKTVILNRLLRRHVLGEGEQFIGVLLPPSVPGVVANVALALDHRIGVNLNYTVSTEVMNACIEQSNIKHILTSRRVMEKLDVEPNAELVYLEDLREKVTWGDKLAGFYQAFVSSAASLEKKYGLNDIDPEDLLTIIFTSGSTGIPKGVMLTQQNIASNVAAIDRVLRFVRHDVLVGILPFFHSFGYTVTLWGGMGIDVGTVFHFNPLDAKQVGKICQTHKGTVLLATPTFLRNYVRRCSRDEFKSLEIVVTGAEKLPTDVADAFESKFGVRPVEGYGATETSPVACVNVPPARSHVDGADSREGTVGRPIPHVMAKITDVDTGEDTDGREPGMLWIKGPNIMQGYMGRDDLTRDVIVDGWYKTGDVARIDSDGFVQITGRLSRFSKIGGEMVPHLVVEERLGELLGDAEEGELRVAVTAVPDPKKGERLVVVHTKIDHSPADLVTGLRKSGLPNLFIPSADSFIQIDEIPVLGTGKMDIRQVKQLAEQAFAPADKPV